MAEAARRIHEMGFRAGLWLAPLAVARESRLFREHADWLVRQRDPGTGETSPAPTDNPDVFSLDCTHPQAIDWLRETFRRVFREWKFDYVKIDFLHYGAREGIRHDPSATSIEAYRRGLEAINREAGPGKFILGCGAPLLASVGLVDGMRVACDVGGRWLFDPGWPDWPVGNCSIRAAAIPSLWSQWMHGRWWQNDSDCLVVRDTSPAYERAFFERLEKETAIKNPGYITTAPGLTPEEAGLWTRLVWMTGGMAFLSEVWSELPSDRRDMLRKCFPAHGRKVSVLDWFGMPDAAVLVARGRPCLCGIFHFGETVLRAEIPAKKLGLSRSWTLRERLSGEEFHGKGSVVGFPETPPHSGRIWEKVS
jgi:alpha-galactosidase